ncbi:BTB/POZ domain-containing protein FBL11 isoform X2 [Solanum pennellii]|uniref:BTB/POZ domain-containing protein FBL11 isoform X2 n=1 Tax=Solanum pennellii TaxID=28526 RepID=A0ABM1UX56_SOLPN|nr:BTB/POZ domain-containing protein FBL11 isoform X2 [Solanum pennellii]
MASDVDTADGETVILNCIDSNESRLDGDREEIVISTAEVSRWDLTLLGHRSIIKIKANRQRLIRQSSYFHGLLSGSFSESCCDSISIHWDMESLLSMLQFIFGCSLDLTSENFLPLYEAALFFGVDKLLLVCRSWLDYVTSEVRIWPPELCLEDLVHIWDYAIDFIPQLTGYLASNFIWMASCDSFHNVPFELLLSCVKQPCLTVDSEKHLCDAILLWLAANTDPSDRLSSTGDARLEILTEIRTSLLSLPFAAGKRRCPFFSKFAERSVVAICSLAASRSFILADILGGGDCNQLRIRLTEYTKILDLSGCPQINLPLLLLNMLPCSYYLDKLLMKKLNQLSLKLERHTDISRISWETFPVLTFEAVQVVDVSNCPMLHLEAAIEFFSKSFPSLTTLKAAYILTFRTMKLYQLLQRCPLLSDIDLTVDSTPVIPAKVSVISSFPAVMLQISTSPNDETCPDVPAFHFSRQLSNITKLILEGRTDIYDSDLQNIAECCPSLCCINLNACTSITDSGISILVLKCVELHSIFACDTSFGYNCVLSLCRNISRLDAVAMKMADDTNSLAYKLQILHIGGCKGINETSLLELISQTQSIRSLCLRETQLVNNSLYKFSGSSLEMLDVSDTKVSCGAVSHVVRGNPLLKCLIARGCRHLLQEENYILGKSPELYYELGKSCNLEEISLGWGFSFFSLEALRPAIKMLRTFIVGLGGSLGEDGLKLVPTFCPWLETLILYFQVVSDSVVRNILETLKNLQVLALCYCFGEISSLSFQSSAPRLRKLKLERVSTQMTNDDLLILSRNCMNLTELSLVGCKCLNSESQDTISNGWPGLISLHLEDCGEITAQGVTSLMNCQALEDLLLRHNGLGIDRNFIIRAASRMPLLRKVAVDVCDAKDGDFDLPDFPNRNFLCILKIARCNLKRRSFGSTKSGTCTTPVHAETLILTWDSRKLSRTVVKERL